VSFVSEFNSLLTRAAYKCRLARQKAICYQLSKMRLLRYLLLTAASLTLCCLARVTNAALILTPLAQFYGTNGASCMAPLLEGADGNFYGTTFGGGSNYNGTIFKMTPNGDLTTLVFFNGTNGANPQGGLVQGADGNFYGTTLLGGAGYGTVFRMTPDGALTTIVSFNGTNGANPASTLIQSPEGNFYGTTGGGGAGGSGTIFVLETNGALTTMAAFNGTNGTQPSHRMVRTADGSLYGTTYAGGPSNLGTIFQMTPDGTLTTLAWFNGTNGANPNGGLAQGTDGNLYGTTIAGGASTALNEFRIVGYGTVFRATTNGAFLSLASFNDANGSIPQGALAQGTDGNFYGTASLGGIPHYGQGGLGVVFQVTTNGTLTDLTAFNSMNGAQPGGGLILASDGLLYGTTVGVNSQAGGEVFRLTNAAPPAFQTISTVGNTIVFTWSALTGQVYQIQYNSALSSTNWNNFWGAYPATTGTMTASDTIGPGPQRFYRVVLLP